MRGPTVIAAAAITVLLAGCGSTKQDRKPLPTVSRPSPRFAQDLDVVCARADRSLRRDENVPAQGGFPIDAISATFHRQYVDLRKLNAPSRERIAFTDLLGAAQAAFVATVRMMVFPAGVDEINSQLLKPNVARMGELAHRLGASGCADESALAEQFFEFP